MALICLLGRHGSGKSTIGYALQEHGYVHLSVGLLRRLATQGHYPSDIPVTLMMALRRARPGVPLSAETATRLVTFATSVDHCVLDGFPASTDHLNLLPASTRFALICAPRKIRETRLSLRSETTQRVWTPGRFSEREANLCHVIKTIRTGKKVIYVSNREDGAVAISRLSAELSRDAKTA